jgi:hypothetical protein
VTRRRFAGWPALLTPAVHTALFLVAPLSADEHSEAIALLTPLASALSAGNAEGFLRRVSEDAPNRAQLVNNINGLVAQGELTSSVQLTTIENGRAEVNWYLEIRSRARRQVLERRKSALVVQIRNGAIYSIEPVSFFKPVEVR